jgi:hypothetical protein
MEGRLESTRSSVSLGMFPTLQSTSSESKLGGQLKSMTPSNTTSLFHRPFELDPFSGSQTGFITRTPALGLGVWLASFSLSFFFLIVSSPIPPSWPTVVLIFEGADAISDLTFTSDWRVSSRSFAAYGGAGKMGSEAVGASDAAEISDCLAGFVKVMTLILNGMSVSVGKEATSGRLTWP